MLCLGDKGINNNNLFFISVSKLVDVGVLMLFLVVVLFLLKMMKLVFLFKCFISDLLFISVKWKFEIRLILMVCR